MMEIFARRMIAVPCVGVVGGICRSRAGRRAVARPGSKPEVFAAARIGGKSRGQNAAETPECRHV
jgi:hypothetical protein